MHKTIRSLYTLVAFVVLLAGCAPATPPTPSAEDIANQVATSVALTVQAQEDMAAAVAQTVEAQKQAEEPTETEEPEQPPTLTPVSPPTATPIVIVPTSGSGGGGAPPRPEYACDVIHKRPYDNTVYRPNDPFDIRFAILNTGTATWVAGKDLMYVSGEKMAPAFGTLELPEMETGDTFDVGPYDANAPAKRGTYIMAFKLEGVSCEIYVAIKVE
jgi:hypothetical protein